MRKRSDDGQYDTTLICASDFPVNFVTSDMQRTTSLTRNSIGNSIADTINRALAGYLARFINIIDKHDMNVVLVILFETFPVKAFYFQSRLRSSECSLR